MPEETNSDLANFIENTQFADLYSDKVGERILRAGLIMLGKIILQWKKESLAHQRIIAASLSDIAKNRR